MHGVTGVGVKLVDENAQRGLRTGINCARSAECAGALATELFTVDGSTRAWRTLYEAYACAWMCEMGGESDYGDKDCKGAREEIARELIAGGYWLRHEVAERAQDMNKFRMLHDGPAE